MSTGDRDALRAELLAPVARWMPFHKARLVAGILEGVVAVEDACRAHALSEDELMGLARAFRAGGQNALRMHPPPPHDPHNVPLPPKALWPFGERQPFSYDLIMIDPPWPTKMRSVKGEKKSAASRYALMTLEDICALPVGDLAASHCVLFVWCTWPMLLYGGDPDRRYAGFDASYSPVGRCLKAWGARYVSGGAWRKLTPAGNTAFGTGYRVRSACEPFLIATIGKPTTSRRERNLIDGLRREHSRKPEAAYAWCERYMPGARRLELFSRTNRPGWDSWGDEAGKFDADAGGAAA